VGSRGGGGLGHCQGEWNPVQLQLQRQLQHCRRPPGSWPALPLLQQVSHWSGHRVIDQSGPISSIATANKDLCRSTFSEKVLLSWVIFTKWLTTYQLGFFIIANNSKHMIGYLSRYQVYSKFKCTQYAHEVYFRIFKINI
jgi:hypothetical protein